MRYEYEKYSRVPAVVLNKDITGVPPGFVFNVGIAVHASVDATQRVTDAGHHSRYPILHGLLSAMRGQLDFS